MKQFVNLYTNDLRPKKEVLPLKQVGILSVISLIAIVAIIVSLNTQNTRLEKEANTIKSEQTKLQENVKMLSQVLLERRADDALKQQLELLKQQKSSFTRLLAKLTKDKETKSARFSDFMEALAEIDLSNVWLSEFQLTGEQLDIVGYLANEKDLSDWLAKFNQQPLLRGRDFSKMRVSQQENKSWLFELTAAKGNP